VDSLERVGYLLDEIVVMGCVLFCDLLASPNWCSLWRGE
jgi:hypothetical protein